MPIELPPGLILIAAGLLLPFLPQVIRGAVMLLAPLATLWLVWQVPDGAVLTLDFIDLAWLFPADAKVDPEKLKVVLIQGDKLSRLFATVFTIMAFGGGLFALHRESSMELAAAFCYAGAAVGVVFAGDFLTVFIFWEVMAIGSTIVIWSGGMQASGAAGMRYVCIHLLGGVLLMAGIMDYVLATQSLAFGRAGIGGAIHQVLGPDRVGTWLILAGFLINAGAPPLSAWLPDAYPEASWSGMVFLSAFTTKTAVYVLIRGYPGFDILIWFGVFMIFYGIVYALLENDMRRILAYSIVNQVGFMVTGVGLAGTSNPEFNALALNGAASHAFTHIIYKALLLMSAGSVLYMTGKRKCTDLGGLFQSMPLTMICGTIGALAISSFPFTSGFISKSMISSSAGKQEFAFVYFSLMAASAGVFLHAGIKFPWFVFFQKDSGLRPPDPPWNMRIAMVIFAAGCIGLGVWPEPFYELLPYPVTYVPYTADHVVEMLQLLLFSGLAFFVLLGLMKRTLTISLDFDWFYRIFGVWMAHQVLGVSRQISNSFRQVVLRGGEQALRGLFRAHGPEGILARTWHTSSMAAWIAILLGVYLLFYFI